MHNAKMELIKEIITLYVIYGETSGDVPELVEIY